MAGSFQDRGMEGTAGACRVNLYLQLIVVESLISIITLNLYCHLAKQVASLIPSDRQETKLREFQYLAQGHTARKGSE